MIDEKQISPDQLRKYRLENGMDVFGNQKCIYCGTFHKIEPCQFYDGGISD